ncbi:MAG: hypothetical protein F2648_00405 [Actinobacteria bacterium]|uniref:Unannotated protein n=1 Tax=freshwater metagenome TaxID=449393 RepID=A0A6J6IRJ4_9ZZZZ|nr:hypothetical protein [Actinomycetota bacterium]MSZ17314.1 hypothetical protein [Actinomycetota bacterium]
METYQVGLIGLAFFMVLALLAFSSWRRRISKQQLTLPKPIWVSGSTNGFKCLYVATTFADRPLERVVGHGLAHRGEAYLLITASGLEVTRTGEVSFLIPKKDLIEVGAVSAVIDRAVEKDGLVSIKWKLGSQELESHFRFVDANLRSRSLSELSSLVGA